MNIHLNYIYNYKVHKFTLNYYKGLQTKQSLRCIKLKKNYSNKKTRILIELFFTKIYALKT